MSAPLASTVPPNDIRPAAEFTSNALTVQTLRAGDEPEVLTFLARRPLYTVVMAGFVSDNGLESSLNRGVFYGCRGPEGRLEGVALLGHATLMEARAPAVLDAFGRFAQALPRPHVIMGEQQVVARFWRGYADAGAAPRLSCRELLFEQRRPVGGRAAVTDLRLATPDDLNGVMEVQARMAFEECGVNPLRTDPVGFRERCRRRIEKGRVWVVSRCGRLVFKADAIADTPEIIYLEGVHVRPDSRGEGLGLDCLSQLGRTLLAKSASICLVVKEGRTEAQDFYRKAGYEFRCYYDTIYPAK
ncbi:MAG TPA: GNAT family N-acetyltransferase [Pyrinomonadaceae bacterium]